MDIDTIRKRIDQLEKLKEEVKISRDMLKGELENDLSYLEAAEEVKAVTQKRKQIKDEILGKGPNQEIVKNIKDHQEEIGTLKEILSAELAEFYRENQTDEIGEHKFKIMGVLLPKKGNFDRRNSMGQYANEE